MSDWRWAHSELPLFSRTMWKLFTYITGFNLKLTCMCAINQMYKLFSLVPLNLNSYHDIIKSLTVNGRLSVFLCSFIISPPLWEPPHREMWRHRSLFKYWLSSLTASKASCKRRSSHSTALQNKMIHSLLSYHESYTNIHLKRNSSSSKQRVWICPDELITILLLVRLAAACLWLYCELRHKVVLNIYRNFIASSPVYLKNILKMFWGSPHLLFSCIIKK